MSHNDHDREIPLDRDVGLRHDLGEEERRLTLSEEELEVGKERHLAGEVEVGKHVETQHVSQQVPVTREEVTIERRPLDGMSATGRIGEDEHIRVPLEREEVVAEKRVVPKEEVLVRKHQVEEERMVEADLRRERVDVEGDARMLGSDGLADRDRDDL